MPRISPDELPPLYPDPPRRPRVPIPYRPEISLNRDAVIILRLMPVGDTPGGPKWTALAPAQALDLGQKLQDAAHGLQGLMALIDDGPADDCDCADCGQPNGPAE